MKKKLLILAGGFSREREISLITAKAVFKQIEKNYTIKICEPDGNLVNNLRKFKKNLRNIYNLRKKLKVVLDAYSKTALCSGILSISAILALSI